MSRGGKRPNAGRPKGKNAYGEATKPIRIPLSKVDAVKTFIKNNTSAISIPLYTSKVRAGFPTPADDYIECTLDLNEHLIQHPSATFFVKAEGDSMIHAGIQSGDMMIVDRSIEPVNGKIIIAAIDGELTVKRLSRQNNRVKLLAENPAYPAIDITDEQNFVIWGVVTHVIHEAR